MLKTLGELLVLFAASVIFLSLSLLQIPFSLFHNSILVLGIVLLVVVNYIILRPLRKTGYPTRIALIFSVSLFVQILVFSTGGFNSPFLIAFHLFAISASFLFGLHLGIGFLAFSVPALIASTIIDQRYAALFGEDPAKILIYIISFLDLIPLYYFIITHYNFKDKISKFLIAQAKLADIKNKSLLESLSEMVIITDTKLHILSCNEEALKTLSTSFSQVVNFPLFHVLYLKDQKGTFIDNQSFSLDSIIANKLTHIISDLFLYTKNKAAPKRVNIQIKPIKNLDGFIDQIIFIISDASAVLSDKTHKTIEEALLKHQAAIEELKNILKEKGLFDLKTRVELLGKAEQDLLTTMEIENQQLLVKPKSIDVAKVIDTVISYEKDFAKHLSNVSLEISYDEYFFKDVSSHLPKHIGIPPVLITSPYFTASTDQRWLDIVAQKLIDIAILLASEKQNSFVKVTLGYTTYKVHFSISFPFRRLSEDEQRFLFTPYYGNLGPITILHLGSGLEGFVAHTIALLLNIPLTTRYDESSSLLYFHLELPK